MKKVLYVLSCLALISTINASQGDEQMSEFQKINELKYGSKQISVGQISVSYSENVELEPDTVGFSITYLTEGVTPNNASNQNVKNMDELRKYLKSLNIKEDEITTTDYRNYESYSYEKDKTPSFAADLTITFNMERDKFYNVIKLLEKNGVTNLQRDDYNKNYLFTIEAVNQSEELARKSVQERFEQIEKLLKNNGVSNIDIKKYETKEVKSEELQVKKYFVSNTINIKTSKLDSVGKIFAKAQELKMSINNDLLYTVSDSKKQKVINEFEDKALSKLKEKAQRVAGKNEYSIGVPLTLNVDSSNINYPEPRYYNSRGVTNSMSNMAQVQEAMEVSINQPSKYTIILTIYGSFDIIQNIKK